MTRHTVLTAVVVVTLVLAAAPGEVGAEGEATPKLRGTLEATLQLLAEHPVPAKTENPASRDNPSGAEGDATSGCQEDAPDEAFLAAWQARAVWLRADTEQRLDGPGTETLPFGNCQLSPAVRQRLLEACEKHPVHLSAVVKLLPRTPESYDRIKTLFDSETARGSANVAWRRDVQRFLMLRSRYFRVDLVTAAGLAHDKDGAVEHGDELEALARLDPAAASPILRSLAEGDAPRTRVLATTLLLRQATEADGTAEALRGQLKRVAADTHAPGRARDLAIEALAETAWPGRDDYLETLFADPTLQTLHDAMWGLEPLEVVLTTAPDQWIPRLTRMVASPNRAVHDNAVTVLAQLNLDKARADALRPLLPWLADPSWSSAEALLRLRIVQSLDKLDLPESVPGLLWVLDHGEGFELDAAVSALAHYGALCGAQEALRRALDREPEGFHQGRVATALVNCGALTAREKADALEAWAKDEAEGSSDHFDPRQKKTAQVALGEAISRSRQGEDVAAILMTRAADLEVLSPMAASLLRTLPLEWGSRIAALNAVAALRSGSASPMVLSRLLVNRTDLHEALAAPLHDMTLGSGALLGVATALLDEPAPVRTVLAGTDSAAQIALLQCATHTRTPLELTPVLALLARRNEAGQAAESYLEALDTPEARRALLAIDDGKVRILGALPGEDRGHTTFDTFGEWESRLVQELKTAPAPDEVVALLCASYWGCDTQILVLRRGGAAELRVWDRPDRFRTRALQKAELDELSSFLDVNRVDDLKPLETFVNDGVQYEYLRLHRQGGVRVYMNNPGDSGSGGGVHDMLTRHIQKLAAKEGLQARYPKLELLAGFEVVLQAEQGSVSSVGARAGSMLVETEMRGEPARWRRLEGGHLAATSLEAPPGRGDDSPSLPDGFEVDKRERSGPAASCGATALVRGHLRGRDGLWLVRTGSEPVLLQGEKLENVALSADCRYLAATLGSTLVVGKADGGQPKPVDLPGGFESWEPVGHLPGSSLLLVEARRSGEQARVLGLAASGDSPPETWRPVTLMFVLDPARRALQPLSARPEVALALARGELQPATRPGAVWLAVPDEKAGATSIGLCDTATLAFEPRLTLPGLGLASRQVYVDEAAGRIWVACDDLLALNLPGPGAPR